MFTWVCGCRSESNGNWRRWGLQWEYVSGKRQSTRHVCRFDQLSLFGETGTISPHIFSFPTDDKHLSPSSTHPSLLSFSSLPPSFPHSAHPSLSLFLYGWVVIFPWDSGGGELSRAYCFIISNKAGNMFRPPHSETLRQKQISTGMSFLCIHSIFLWQSYTYSLFFLSTFSLFMTHLKVCLCLFVFKVMFE